MTDGAVNRLEEYNFPGNVRELINILEAAVLVSNGTINSDDITARLSRKFSSTSDVYHSNGQTRDFFKGYTRNWGAAQQQFKKDLFVDTLQLYNGNVEQTAKALGMARSNVYVVIQRMGYSSAVDFFREHNVRTNGDKEAISGASSSS